MTLSDAIGVTTQYSKDTRPTILFLVGELGAGKTHFVNQFT